VSKTAWEKHHSSVGGIVRRILVVFPATQEHTESLAFEVGLGALQCGAEIRLRHLDPSPPCRLSPKAYGTLSETDLLWAEGIVVGVEAKASAEELCALARTIQRLGAQGKLAHKNGCAFGLEGVDSAACAAASQVASAMKAAKIRLLKDEPSSILVSDVSMEAMNQMGQLMALMN
jgi:hypothetical protein